MSNIEEDIKIIENYLKDSSYKEKDNSFFKGSGWEVVDLEIPKAIANVLIEFKKKAERIKELEEENADLKIKNNFRIVGSYAEVRLEEILKNDYIPKQKVKEILDRLHITDIEPWSFYKISGDILFDLKELLEDK